MSTPDIYELLHSSSAIEELTGERIFPILQSGHVYPSLVYSLVGTRRGETYCGDTRLVTGSFQFDMYAQDYRQVVALSDAVREYVLGFKGVVAGTKLRHCTLLTENDSMDIDPGLFRRTQQWDIWYEDRS